MGRYILKVSGEAFGNSNQILSEEKTMKIIMSIKKIISNNHKLAIINGGGNIWRGRASLHMDTIDADYVGMQAININAYFLYSLLKAMNIKTYICSAISVCNLIDLFEVKKAQKYYDDGYVVIIGGGLGVPGISTDTAIVSRAIQLKIDNILMAKNIEGVYDIFPVTSDSKIYKEIKASDLLVEQKNKVRGIIDNEALELLVKNNFNTYIYKYDNEDAIDEILQGKNPGTIIK